MNNLYHALSHPVRRRVLALLRDGPMSAGDLADRFEVSKPTMSGHFHKLKEAGLIHADQRGNMILYSINMSVLEEAVLGFMSKMGVSARTKGETA